MYKVKITVIKKSNFKKLQNLYENKIDHPCDLKINQEFISIDGKIPDGFCSEAWKSIEEFVIKLSNGKTNLFGNWMKNPKSAMISCNDGFRPVSFLLERID